MGLGPIAGIHSITLPTARKAEQTAPRFDIEASERSGDEPSARQQASERERKKEDAGDLFQATAEENGEVEAISLVSEEGHDWFV
jgi:hypothetical protein